jgi:3-oxoacyl-[acyl-carrier protein] reductase
LSKYQSVSAKEIHMSTLTGKVAIVTGASKGIGAAIAKTFGAAGAAVVVNYASDQAGADKTVETIIKAGGKAIAVHGNVSKQEDAQAIVDATIKAYGKLDTLVNNAGVFEFSPLEAITAEHFHKQFDINVLGLLFVTQAAAKHLGKGASIINIGSLAGAGTMPGSAVYSATKAALNAVTTVLAAELGPKGVRVNALNPGGVVTEGSQAAGFTDDNPFVKQMIATTPLGRLGQPNDIATAALFLASDDAGWITGQLLSAGGGAR